MLSLVGNDSGTQSFLLTNAAVVWGRQLKRSSGIIDLQLKEEAKSKLLEEGEPNEEEYDDDDDDGEYDEDDTSSSADGVVLAVVVPLQSKMEIPRLTQIQLI